MWRNNISSKDVEEVKAAYAETSKIPLLVSCQYDQSSRTVKSKWSQVNLADLSSKKAFVTLTHVQEDDNLTVHNSKPITVQVANELEAESGNKTVRITESNSNQILEVWIDHALDKVYNLTQLDLHGPVYFDNQFGGLSINKSADKVAYIAELKRPKSSSFFKPGQDPGGAGQQFKFYEDWGEQMTGKSQSVIVTLDLNLDDFKVWSTQVPGDLCPGLPVWINDNDIIGIGVNSKPWRLGMVFTNVRPSLIFKLSTSSGMFSSLRSSSDTSSSISCKSPRLSLDRTRLLWLERDLSETIYPGPHWSCQRLMALDFREDQSLDKPRIVIDMVFNFVPGQDNFAGLYMGQLPARCFSNNNQHIIFSCIVNDTPYPVICNTDRPNDFTVLTNSSHVIVTDVSDDIVVGQHSDPLSSPKVVLSQFNPLLLDQGLLFKTICHGAPLKRLKEDWTWTTLIHKPQESHPNPAFKDVMYSSLYVGPKIKKAKGLILWPHGGPHAVLPAIFSSDIYFFLQMGYGVLCPNYRGSRSQGQNSILSLASYVGNHDVKDCKQAMEECLNTYPEALDAKQVVLYGGSHGGFLVTHLAGQYPEDFRAVVARNPVTNISTKIMTADNPDSGFNASGFSFDFQSPTPKIMETLYNNSPMAHVDKVIAPVHLNIGSLDKRVHHSQGIEYYHNLKAIGKADVSMDVYEDNHPLAKASSHVNIVMNAMLFFNYVLFK